MAGYKYRVYDSYTGDEFADVATLKLALDLTDGLREAKPGVTIDEIVPELAPSMRTPIVGDTVRTVGRSISGNDAVIVGELLEIDTRGSDSWTYKVKTGSASWQTDWYQNVTLS